MQKFSQTTFVFILIFSFSSCSNDHLQKIKADSQRIFSTPKIIQKEAKFNKEKISNIKITETNLPTSHIRSQVFSFGEFERLFIASKLVDGRHKNYLLYITSDGGKTWESKEFNTPETTYVTEVFFINPSVGWVILNDNANDWEDDSQTGLMKTIDGGKSWKILKSETKTRFDEISFVDEMNGWMSANLYSLEPTVTVRPQILKTTDGGETWTDTSEPIRKILGIDSGRATIVEMFVENKETVKIITAEDKFFRSQDGGNIWEQFGPDLSFFPNHLGIGNLGNVGKSNRNRIAGGGWTSHGHDCYFASKTKNGSWELYWIKEPFNLHDILYVSENQILISGSHQKSLLTKDWNNIYAIIHYSSDGGKTFATIYQTKKAKGFETISRISDNHFIVVSDNGLIIDLEFPKLVN